MEPATRKELGFFLLIASLVIIATGAVLVAAWRGDEIRALRSAIESGECR